MIRIGVVGQCLVLSLLLVGGQEYASGEGGQRELPYGVTDRLGYPRERAIAELRALAGTLQRLRSPESRARITARLADSLWTVDEALARKLFEEALSLILQAESNSQRDSPVARERRRSIREEIVSQAVARDPRLADRLLAALSREPDATDPLRPTSERMHAMLASAIRLLPENPERAIRMVRKSLNEGIIDRTLFFLHTLRSQDPQQADLLFERAVRTAASRMPPNLNELLLLGSYLFSDTSAITFSLIAGRPAINIAPGAFRTEAGSPTLIRMYLETVFHLLSAFAHVPSQHLAEYERGLIVSAIRNLLPFYDRHRPDLVPVLLGIRSQLAPHLPPASMVDASHDSPTISDRPDILLERTAEEKDPSTRDRTYLRLLYALYTQGEYEAAREIAERLSDSRARARIAALLDTAIWRERMARGIEPSSEVSERSKTHWGALVRSPHLDVLQESLLIVEWAKQSVRRGRGEEAKPLLHGQIARVLADRADPLLRWKALTGLLGALGQIAPEETFSLIGTWALALPPDFSLDEASPPALYMIEARGYSLPFLLSLGEEFRAEKIVENLARRDLEATLQGIALVRSEEARAELIVAACRALLR